MSIRFSNIGGPFEAADKERRKFYNDLSVLVLEETSYAASLIQGILKNLGIGVILPAHSEEKALSILSQHQVQVAIVNGMEPPHDGLGFVRTIRTASQKLPQALPIILVTARAELTYVTQARDAGVTEILSKPFSAAQLQTRIDSAIKKPRPLVQAGSFVGPDRRRRTGDPSSGKRATDKTS